MGNENLLNIPGHMTMPIFMVKNFKTIFLRNQEADDFETWYTASGTRILTILHMMTLG